MSCGCNNNGTGGVGPSTTRVCGTFDQPTNPDQGICSPRKQNCPENSEIGEGVCYTLAVKITCERPSRGAGECPGEFPVPIYNPGGDPPFSILTGLYDQNCEPIQDQNNLQITTIIEP